MLMNMQRLLRIANENHFAIPAFNIGSLVMLNAVMECCEEEQAPVIIAIHPDELKFVGEHFVKAVLILRPKSQFLALFIWIILAKNTFIKLYVQVLLLL